MLSKTRVYMKVAINRIKVKMRFSTTPISYNKNEKFSTYKAHRQLSSKMIIQKNRCLNQKRMKKIPQMKRT